jgi:hypothetical protein
VLPKLHAWPEGREVSSGKRDLEAERVAETGMEMRMVMVMELVRL